MECSKWDSYWKPGEQERFTDALRGVLSLPPIPVDVPEVKHEKI